MAAPVISISSDSSKESMGSYAPRVILFGTIPTSILVILVVPDEVLIEPVDPIVALEVGAVSVSHLSECSIWLIIHLLLILIHYSEFEPAEQRPKRHESLTPSSEFPLAHVVASPEIRWLPKRVVPFLARRLAWRRVSHHSLADFTLDSSFSSLSSDSSSDISLGPLTRVASPRLVDPPIRTLRCSEAFMRWRSAPLSTLYPPTTSESSLDSSSERSLNSSSHSARPSHKRYRSLTTLVPSSTLVSRSIAHALADLSPYKRFRYSYSFKVSEEEHMEMGTVDAETVADLGIRKGVGAHTEDGIDLGAEVATNDIREDEEEFEAKASAGGTMEITVDPLATGDIYEPTGGDAPDLEGTLYDISYYMSEVPLDRITEFETTQRQLEASRKRDGLADRVRSLGRENLRVQALLCIGRDRVDSLCRHMVLSLEEFHHVRKDHDDTRMRLKRLESLVERHLVFSMQSKNSLIDEWKKRWLLMRNCGNGNPNENDRGAIPVARECTYKDFIKCQPLKFKGTEGVVGLIKWFEKIGILFYISNCPEKYQVKYATCTLLNSALTWWNSHKRTIGTDVAFVMAWRELMKLTAEMVLEEEDRVDKFIGGLPDNIQGNVIDAEPTRLQDAVRIANNLMDQKLKGYPVKMLRTKESLITARKTTVGSNHQTKNIILEDRMWQEPTRLATMKEECIMDHYLSATSVNFIMKGHRGQVVNQRVITCYECRRQGHYRNDCLKLKDQNCRNKTGSKNEIGEARGKAYVLGGGDANPDSNVITDVSYAIELADGRITETNTILRGSNHHAVIVCDEKIC
nr:hypothetical protein [Tanacetum cinerariifolium]